MTDLVTVIRRSDLAVRATYVGVFGYLLLGHWIAPR